AAAGDLVAAQDFDYAAWQDEMVRQGVVAQEGTLRQKSAEEMASWSSSVELMAVFGRLQLSNGRRRNIKAYCGGYPVPFGSYDGRGILRLSDNDVNYSTFPSFQPWGNGWSFEPGGLLYRSVRTFFVAATVPATCQMVVRYTYTGPGGSLTFLNKGVEQICSVV